MNGFTSHIDMQRRGSAVLARRWRLRFTGPALAAALLAACQPPALQATTPRAATPQATTPQTVARLRQSAGEIRPVTTATLFRDQVGMLFALLPEPASNLVRVDVRYRSGSAADPEDKSGLAHLVEHVTFHLREAPGAPTLAARLSRDALAFNAYTTWDETHYYATALASQVDALIAIESDRLRWGCDGLSEVALAHERRVVQRELESKLPTTSVLDQVRQAAFASGHPYHRGTGGHPEQIPSLSLADVCRFIADQYRPDNAILVVSGQFDVAAVTAALEARYGTLSQVAATEPKPAGPVLPPGSALRTLSAEVSNPALVVLVDSPRWGSPESARHPLALSVLAERLRERVQADDTVIATGQFQLGGWHGGTHAIVIEVRDEDGLDHAARLVRDVGVDPLFGLGDDAFAAAKARFQAGLIRAHDSFGARAVAISDALQYGHARGIDGMLAAASQAGRGEIEADIRRGIERMRTIRVLPAGERETDGVNLAADAPATSQPRDLIAAAADVGGESLPWAPAVDDREADQDLVLPLPAHAPAAGRRLANGLRVVLLPRSGYPMVYARMLFAGGRRAEPAGRKGLSELAALLRRPGMSAPWSPELMGDLAAVASLPVEIDALVEPAATIFSGSSPSAHASALLWSMHLQVRYGGYLGISDIGKVLWRKHLDAIAAGRRTSVEGIMNAVVEGDAASERELEALKATVSRLQQADLADYAARNYRPDNGTLIVAGDFDAERMMATIEELFAGWRPQATGDLAAAGPASPRAVRAVGGKHVLLTDASRKQPRLIATYPDVLDDDNRAAALVLRAILETRLSRALREDMGATYHVSVSFHGDALVIDTELGGPQADLSVARAQAVVAGLLDERFRADFILARRKSLEQALANSMSAALLIERASRVQQAGGTSDPLDELAREIARLRPAEVAALVEERMQAARASLIIVAPRQRGLPLFSSIGIHSPRIVE
jgi:zinc protease